MSARPEDSDPIRLPAPRHTGEVSLEEAIARRRSVREFVTNPPLTLEELSQILWAAQGITEPRGGLRAAPSAGALYPLDLYVVVGLVSGLSPGVYRYARGDHGLVLVSDRDLRREFSRVAAGQIWIARAGVIVVLAAVYARTTGTYGERGRKYVHMEAGHVSENICLQAVALGLGSTVVGAFEDAEVKSLLALPAAEHPVGSVVIGRVRPSRPPKSRAKKGGP